MARPPHGLLGRIQRANDDASHRFGPNTAEVEAFINAAVALTPWQWRQVLAARRLVASVTKEETGDAESAKSIQASIRSTEGGLTESMASAGEVLFDSLVKKSEDKQVAAWHAMSALVMRGQLPALKFAVHYAPFATLVPVTDPAAVDPTARRFLIALEGLSTADCDLLARRWRLEPAASRALLHAVGKRLHVKTEETVAMAALTLIPTHLTGDSGWSAVRTVVHGGRVLGSAPELTREQVVELWAPLEPAIPLASLDEEEHLAARARVQAAVSGAIKSIKSPRGAAKQPTTPPARAPAPYGPNSVEVAAFIKGVTELTPIQWLRVLDRRQLVASVTREGSAEPAGVVRSIIAAIDGTRDLDMFTRCRAFAAVERAGFALEAHRRNAGETSGRPAMSAAQLSQMYEPFAETIPIDRVNGSGFAHRIASLGKHDWQRVAGVAPAANEEAVAPLVSAGTALIDFFGGRSDDEAVAVWHAVSALVRRQHLTPIKFAASYAPFASAIPVTNPRTLGAMVSRYVTAVGRLGASQCLLLSHQWEIDDDLSNALSKAMADGSARLAEEAAALAAVVTVPMRLAGSSGWAAVKTAAYGGRVIALRGRLSVEQIEALWKPLQGAIPLAALGAPARVKR
jgi:hypothetical protein